MTSVETIELIINKPLNDIFPDLDTWKDKYNEYIKILHPDKCSDKNASTAVAKLNKFKTQFEKDSSIEDDSGKVNYKFKSIVFKGDTALLTKSYENYNKLMNLKDPASNQFKKYLPSKMRIVTTPSFELHLEIRYRAIPLSALLSELGTIEQKHVNWILSRLLEFSSWLNQVGYVHCGINLDSIFVVPEDHGIICTSFYHLTKLNQKLTTISAKFSHLYPANVFKNKLAESNIDIELSKRIAINLLGDKSGLGTILRKTIKEDILNFLQKTDNKPFECYDEYRKLLKKNYKSEFHILNI